MAVDVFANFAAALQGIEGVMLSKAQPGGLTYDQGFLVPYPQLISLEEEVSTSNTPGGNVTADENSRVQSALITLRWARMNLEQQAQIQGSFYELSGSSPHREHRLKRRSGDVAPYFKIEGRVDYVGSDFPGADWHLIAFRCKMVGTPTWSHETGENYATCEMQFRVFFRGDGEFYHLVMNETSIPLTVSNDTTPPTVLSTTPADDATGVALAAATFLVVYSEAVREDPSFYTIQRIVSSTNVVDVPFTLAVNEDGDEHTLTPTGGTWTASSNYNVRISRAKDLAGNELATAVNRQFATAAS